MRYWFVVVVVAVVVEQVENNTEPRFKKSSKNTFIYNN